MKPAGTAYVLTGVVIVLAAVAALGMYQRYTTKPWTRDGQVRANIVGIASRVEGPIIQIPIREHGDAGKTAANFDDPQARPYLESICVHLVNGLAARHASKPPMPSLPTL